MKQIILIGIFLALPFTALSRNVSLMTEEALKKASSQGNAEAAAELADRYYDEDPLKAVELYTEAAEKGNFHAISRIGYFYQKGLHVDQSLTAAGSLYEIAIRIATEEFEKLSAFQKFLYSINILKRSKKEQSGLQKILKALFTLHEADLYPSPALLKHGIALFGSFHKEETAALYKKAEEGDVKDLLKLAQSLDEQNEIEKRFLLVKAAGLGSVEAMLSLAHIYKDGPVVIIPHEKQLKKAVQLYKEAVEKGSARAAAILASIYHHGLKDGFSSLAVRPNPLNARVFYHKAAALGNISATRDLARVYEEGELKVRPNLEKAIQYYVMILDDKSGEDIYLKSAIFSKLKSIAKEHGLSSVQYHLGRFYRDGVNGGKDLDSHLGLPNLRMAEQFFKEAADQGHKEASEAIKSLNLSDSYQRGEEVRVLAQDAVENPEALVNRVRELARKAVDPKADNLLNQVEGLAKKAAYHPDSVLNQTERALKQAADTISGSSSDSGSDPCAKTVGKL